MNDMLRFKLADWLWMGMILVSAIGIRSWYVAACADGGRRDGPWQVQEALSPDLEALAKNWTQRWSFASRAPLATAEETTAHTAPAFPFLLSLASRFPGDRDLMVRWVQVGIGALTALLYFVFALQAFQSRPIAVLAGLLCTLHPFWIVNTATINDGTLTSFLLAIALVLGLLGSRRGGALTSLANGLVLAALALVRAPLLPFAFVAMLWFLLRCRTLPRGWFYGLLAFLGFVNGLVPWIVRNYQVTGHVVLVVDSLPVHLWMGYNPRANGGIQSEEVLRETLAEARGQEVRDLDLRLAEQPQAERYRRLALDVGRQIRNDPAGALRRRLQAGLCFVFGAKWFQDGIPWTEEGSVADRAPPWLASVFPALLLGSLLSLLLLGFLGWRWTFSQEGKAMPSSLAVVFLALPYLLSHAEQLHGPRLPLDGVLLCYGAFALVVLLRFGKASREEMPKENRQ
jgi:4-amino-4-deoxy-L-arabinose transferase-like glycosyltransferase